MGGGKMFPTSVPIFLSFIFLSLLFPADEFEDVVRDAEPTEVLVQVYCSRDFRLSRRAPMPRLRPLIAPKTL